MSRDRRDHRAKHSTAGVVVPLRAVERSMPSDSAEVLEQLAADAKRNRVAGMWLTYVDADGIEHSLVTGCLSKDLDKALAVITRTQFQMARAAAARAAQRGS